MSIYLISDTHFNDADVIKEYDRPFDSVEEMEEVLINRWNQEVSESDSVIVVGDFARVENQNQVWIWLSQLQGEIILVDGNHRPVPRSSFNEIELPLTTEYTIEKNGYEFYCAHKPNWVPENWTEWKIYGHYHNRYPEKYPFIDPENKRINLSAEVIDYTPVSIEKLIELIQKDMEYTRLPDK